jgi:hypothetical protein
MIVTESRLAVYAVCIEFEHIDEYRQSRLQLVARIEAIAIPRLADEMAAAVRAGETVSIVPVGPRCC